MTRTFQPSALALAILVLLHESPMHPYRMQRLIKERGKDEVINVGQRASLYQTIHQLLRAGLIAFWESERQEGFPERTVYRLTGEGHEAAVRWMRKMLSQPSQEFPEFPAAVSLLPLLPPEDALRQLEIRETHLSEKLSALIAAIQAESGHLDRLFLLESEYQQVVLQAELQWVRSVIQDLRSGRLTWTGDWMHPSSPPEHEG